MLEAMNELDEIWSRTLAAALAEAETAGRSDVAEYLLLKTANDAVRRAAVEWLFDSTLAVAAEANRQNAALAVESESPHSFAHGNSNIVGSLLRLRRGVRCLTVEAGWTRRASDGFMRGGALALARVSHFGMSAENQELLLVRDGDAVNWFSFDAENRRFPFDSRNIQRHFQTFLDTI